MGNVIEAVDVNGTNRYGKEVVLATLKKPAIVYDVNVGLLKIGESCNMKDYFNTVVITYLEAGMCDMARDMRYLDLPLDQEMVSNIINKQAYVLSLHKELNLK